MKITIISCSRDLRAEFADTVINPTLEQTHGAAVVYLYTKLAIVEYPTIGICLIQSLLEVQSFDSLHLQRLWDNAHYETECKNMNPSKPMNEQERETLIALCARISEEKAPLVFNELLNELNVLLEKALKPA